VLSVHRGRTVIVARITNFSKGSVRLPQPWCPPPAANSGMLGRGHDLICVVEPTSLLPLCWVLPSCNRPDIVAKACWPSAEVKLQYFAPIPGRRITSRIPMPPRGPTRAAPKNGGEPKAMVPLTHVFLVQFWTRFLRSCRPMEAPSHLFCKWSRSSAATGLAHGFCKPPSTPRAMSSAVHAIVCTNA
jgi:hypothetical protein